MGNLNTLSNQSRQRSGPPVLLILVFLALMGGGGYFGWHVYQKSLADRRAAAQAALLERQREAAEAAKRKAAEEAAKKAAAEEEAKRKAAEEAKRKAEEEAKRRAAIKTPQQLWLEELAARKAVRAQIEEACKTASVPPPTRMGGISFAEPLAGEPVRWGPVLDAGDSVDARGATFAVFGPKRSKPFMTLDPVPLVWVTPKTRIPYRVEFSRKLALKNGAVHDPATTNIVVKLRDSLKTKAFTTSPYYVAKPGCEFVFPLKSGTVTVGEYGDRLLLVVERDDLKQQAKAESDALRKETLAGDAADDDAKLLDSKRYPQGEFGRYPKIKFKPGTPEAFCGFVFGRQAKPLTPIVTPQQGAKGYFIDYRRAKCKPFRGFDRGRADIDPVRGGVYAVHLFNEGGMDGLDDVEYFNRVRATLTRHYKTEPTEQKGELPFPELTYRVGDVEIAFGPEPQGGFHLKARQTLLADLARKAPASRKRP